MKDTCNAWRPKGTSSSLNRPSKSAAVTLSGTVNTWTVAPING